jgi:hypothetical protein
LVQDFWAGLEHLINVRILQTPKSLSRISQEGGDEPGCPFDNCRFIIVCPVFECTPLKDRKDRKIGAAVVRRRCHQ